MLMDRRTAGFPDPILLFLCPLITLDLKFVSGEEIALSAERWYYGLIFCTGNLGIPLRC